MNTKLRRFLLVLFSCILVLSLTMLLRDYLRAKREAKANQELSMLYSEMQERSAESEAEVKPETDVQEPVPESEEDRKKRLAEEKAKFLEAFFSELLERNGDTAGWLRIDGAGIDYPVVYTPSNQNYYLRKGFDKAYAQSGTLFLAVPWGEDSRNCIVYGHHMNDHTMFGDLNKYAKEEFAKENSLISFDTIYGSGDYELFAAFYTEIFPMNDTAHFHYYDFADLPDQKSFEYFVKQVKALALYDTGVEPVWGDRLLTLSTCEYHKKNGRFVVVARKITE